MSSASRLGKATATTESAPLPGERRAQAPDARGVLGADRQHRPSPVRRRRERGGAVASDHVALRQPV